MKGSGQQFIVVVLKLIHGKDTNPFDQGRSSLSGWPSFFPLSRMSSKRQKEKMRDQSVLMLPVVNRQIQQFGVGEVAEVLEYFLPYPK